MRVVLKPLKSVAFAISTFAMAAACSQAPEATSPETPPPTAEEVSVTKTAQHEHTNRLVDETSPYLLQHAHNPVDWYPWGEEALQRARDEDKPIFLSVGYSSCHWCHVMERESFENEEIAAVLNEHFVSIKVDREERPDIDEIYMTAVQAMTGSGGWPMSVFLTPDLEPFYGGTYFPPVDRYGRPGFKTVLERLALVWVDKRDEIEQNAERLTGHLKDVLSAASAEQGELDASIFANAVEQLKSEFDARHGGFGDAPKFPSSGGIAVLLRHYDRTGDEAALQAATLTLDKMAQGGMYDHLGGGFARYSTDDLWLVPHFEKMLYDNAQLAQVYLEGYQATKDPYYARVARETLDYVLNYMTGESGGFYSAEDADSEGEEGKFYIWDYDELAEALGGDAEDVKLFTTYYNVKPNGNFSSHESYHAGLNILHTTRTDESIAQEFGLSMVELRQRIDALRAKALQVRDTRVRPGLDDKVLTAWNGLMITAFAQGYQVLGEERYRDAAVKASRFILDEMTGANGELLRTHRAGESRLPAYLDDYAFFANALVDVYETTFDAAWLDAATRIADGMLTKFWDAESAGFYYTSEEHTNLLVRTRASQDNATPAGSSIATLALLRLAKLTDNAEYYDDARAVLRAHQAYLTKYPRAFLKLLVAADFYVHAPKEIAIAGQAEGEDTARLLDAVHETFVPNKVVAFVDPSASNAASLGERLPLLAGKTLVDGSAAAYVCKDYACRRPTTQPDELVEQLNES